jgi:itaconate CoA-transferase
MTPFPLDGILVVACEHAVAGPLATRHLGDLGARVIKVERPDGGDFARAYDTTVGGLSSHFVWLNRGKESVCLDLRDPESRVAMRSLVSRSDVFLQNLGPGTAGRLGLSSTELRSENPRLITCDISGYGTDGPLHGSKAYDLLIQAEAGLLAITGSELEPAKSGIPVADIAAGMYAFSAVLAALYERERTGSGAGVEVNLFDSLVEWMGYPIYYTRYGGTAPARTGTSHAAIAPYGIVRCGDGGEVMLAVQNDREWQEFCTKVMGDQALAGDPRFRTGADRVRNRGPLDDLIHERWKDRTSAQLVAALEAAEIATARVRSVEEVINHPQLIERSRWAPVQTEVGEIEALKPPIAVAGRESSMGSVPALGEHTQAVLGEFGLGAGHVPTR